MRAAILSCEDAPKWHGWTEKLWGNLTEGQITSFRCYCGEFPDVATCRDRFDVIVVGGSHYSAYDDLPWIRQLEQLLPQYIAAGVRVVGCCFGHQILAKALGGSVGQNPSGRFVLGVEDVVFDLQAARACGLQLPSEAPPPASTAPSAGTGVEPRTAGGSAAGAARPGLGSGLGADRPGQGPGQRLRLRLLQSHGDQVLALPPGATLLATSGTSAHEMWALGDRCLAFQFHPELTPELLYDKIWTALSASGRLNAQETAATEAQLKSGPAGVDSGLFWKALQAYITAPAPEPLPGAVPAPALAASSSSSSQPASGAAAADAAAAAAQGGLQAVAAIRQAMEQRASRAAEDVLGHVRQAAAAGMAVGTSSAELLTSLNREAAAAYGSAATAAQSTTERVVSAVATQQEPLKAALASLGALEAQLDRLAAVVGSLEEESEVLEGVAAARSTAAAAATGTGTGGEKPQKQP